MLLETLLAHPLLSQLIDIEENPSKLISQELRKTLKAGDTYYIIGAKELRLIFQRLCEKQNEDYRNFLVFDYTSLHLLDEEDPFYISTVNVIDRQQLLKQILFANKQRHRNVALTLLNELTDWIESSLNQVEDIFDIEVAKIISAVSIYMPEKAFKKLSEVCAADSLLSSYIIDNESYSIILEALSNLAFNRQYFEFATSRLLQFATQEIKLGIYHANYKAGIFLSKLFVRPTAILEISFQDRCNYLEQNIKVMDEASDYYQLVVMMYLLGYIANKMLSVDSYSALNEAYARFCVYQLLHYAGRKDEHGLDYTAEEQLHIILDESISNDNTDIAFIIFKYQNEYKREWNVSHFCALNKLFEDLQDFKADKWVKSIRKTELRLQQLESIEGGREFLSTYFALYFGAKKPEKRCEINLDRHSNLSLHHRQSLAERLIYSETTSLLNIQRSWPKTTYVVANVGVVITNKPHIKAGDHQRLFITVPINSNDLSITGRNVYGGNGHAEEALYAFLLTPIHLNEILEKIKTKLMVESLIEHKVYAFVIDLHGTYDMCQSCSTNGVEFQNSFREYITTHFKLLGVHLPQRFVNQLSVVFRYSSDLSYHYPNESNPKKRGLRCILEGEEFRRDMDLVGEIEDSQYSPERDIRHYNSNLLVHGKSNWHSFWSKKTAQENPTPIRLEKWTAFTTDYSMRFMSDSRRSLPYTKSDGTVGLGI